MNILRKILVALLVVLIILQFVPVDRSVPDNWNEEQGLIAMSNPDKEVVQLLETACYDCHSYETNYPWYAYTAPAKWFLQGHVNEGREHVNFSVWGTYPPDDRKAIADEAQEEVEEKHMPISSYLWMHADAKLDPKQEEKLLTFFEGLAKQ
jgi:hypothetical protein